MIYQVFNRQYVAAIIDGTDNLKLWMDKVPPELLKKLLIERIADSYPFAMIEFRVTGGNRFFVNGGQGVKAIEEMKINIRQSGHEVLTTYSITEDFHGDPQNPGKDYMGILDHDHEPEDEDEEPGDERDTW